MTEDDDTNDSLQATNLCTNCVRPVPDGVHFCPHCNAPASNMAMCGPYERVLSMGFMYHKATTRPRSLIVVIGIWLLCAPQIVISWWMLGWYLHYIVKEGVSRTDLVGPIVALVIFSGMLWIYGKILVRTTAGYLQGKATPESDPEEDAES